MQLHKNSQNFLSGIKDQFQLVLFEKTHGTCMCKQNYFSLPFKNSKSKSFPNSRHHSALPNFIY